jgi:hypothetical protein
MGTITERGSTSETGYGVLVNASSVVGHEHTMASSRVESKEKGREEKNGDLPASFVAWLNDKLRLVPRDVETGSYLLPFHSLRRLVLSVNLRR